MASCGPTSHPTENIAYSRAEPSPGLPGWKALNDLTILPFNNGKLGKGKEIIKASASAPYAWWGTNFDWSPDSQRLAYGNTAEIGLISPTAKITRTTVITDFAAYNTRSTWAWTPALSWSPDGQFLATQIHSPSPTGESDEDSPAFDVAALQVSGTLQTPLAVGAGMWATPQWLGTTSDNSQIVFGMAETPYASDTSRYFLYVMDRDGSNRRLLFPADGNLAFAACPTSTSRPTGAVSSSPTKAISIGSISIMAAHAGCRPMDRSRCRAGHASQRFVEPQQLFHTTNTPSLNHRENKTRVSSSPCYASLVWSSSSDRDLRSPDSTRRQRAASSSVSLNRCCRHSVAWASTWRWSNTTTRN